MSHFKVKKYLSSLEFYDLLTNLRKVNWKIDNILKLSNDDFRDLPSHTKVSILKVLGIIEDTDGYYVLFDDMEAMYNHSLHVEIQKIRNEIHEKI